MAYIAVPIPNLPGKQDIEIEVRINGVQQQMHYKVELLRWADCPDPSADRVECIRHLISQYDHEWTLYFIGAPTDDFVPVTFARKEELAKQRRMLRGESA